MTEASQNAANTLPTPVEVFCCYSYADERWLRKLEVHLSLLKRQGFISLWHDQLIPPGTDRAEIIDRHLETASVILLLVSADFLASDYCYSLEMKRAIARQEAGEACVIPILVRPVDWKGAPFTHLQALPSDAKPLATRRKPEKALADVVAGIRRMIEDWPLASTSSSLYSPPLSSPSTPFPSVIAVSSPPRGQPAEPSVTTATSPNPLPEKTAGKLAISRRAVLIGVVSVIAIAAVGTGVLAHEQSLQKHVMSPPSPTAPLQEATVTPQNHLFTYAGHFGPVDAVAWSPNGQRIASGSWDRTVQVWNASDGGNVFTYRGHSGVVDAVAWSPDGKWIASGSWDKTVQVWNASDGSDVFTYRGHSDSLWSVAWSPDGKWIASGSVDKTVQVWHVR